MKPVKVCPNCGSATDLPHGADVDCFRALDRDIKATLAQLRALTKRKSQLLRLRIRRRQRAAVARRRSPL